MKRVPTNQDITWFLDLKRTNQLNLEPPYQRRSVWTNKDRKFFLDTIFRNYPAPPIYLHKEINDEGITTYNVVDGKQRLQTILMFSNNELAIAEDYGDTSLNNRKFNQLSPDQKKAFWNYALSVDFITVPEGTLIKEIFDRMNRNSKNLNRQELRHAKFSGWFVNLAEEEAENELWTNIGFSTKAKAKRMRDIQFISELLAVLLDRKIAGFNQDYLDEKYAEFENPEESNSDFNTDEFIEEKERIINYIGEMENHNEVISDFASTANDLYSLWALLALEKDNLPDNAEEFAQSYHDFMERVDALTEETATITDGMDDIEKAASTYFLNSRGASTDFSQRHTRLDALRAGLI